MNSVAKNASALNIAHVRNVAMQTLLKPARRQIELGMMAGRPCFSCLPTQKTKAGTSMNEMTKRMIFSGLRVDREDCAVIEARTYDRVDK